MADESPQMKLPCNMDCCKAICLAEWTGLEPATPGVTGRYSNQLNYHSVLLKTSCGGAALPLWLAEEALALWKLCIIANFGVRARGVSAFVEMLVECRKIFPLPQGRR